MNVHVRVVRTCVDSRTHKCQAPLCPVPRPKPRDSIFSRPGLPVRLVCQHVKDRIVNPRSRSLTMQN